MISKIKKGLTEPVVFVAKVVITVFVIIVALYLMKGILPLSALGRIWKEERGKKVLDEIDKTDKKVSKTKTRLESLRDEISDYLSNNGELPYLDDKGNPITEPNQERPNR